MPSAPISAENQRGPPPPPPPPRMEVEVELRNKYAIAATKKRFCPNSTINNAITTPLEKVGFCDISKKPNYWFCHQILEDLLKKLQLDRVVWSLDKQGNFHQVIFPTGSGDSCETTLHCLTQLGIGVKFQSNVRWVVSGGLLLLVSSCNNEISNYVLCFSVIPCSVVYDGQEKSDKDFDDWWVVLMKWI